MSSTLLLGSIALLAAPLVSADTCYNRYGERLLLDTSYVYTAYQNPIHRLRLLLFGRSIIWCSYRYWTRYRCGRDPSDLLMFLLETKVSPLTSMMISRLTMSQ
jgi:hypothetical protein